jgi:ribosome maturation factor RimP
MKRGITLPLLSRESGPRAHFFFCSKKEEMKLEASLEKELAAIAAEERLELLSVEVVGSGPKTTLRLVVDGPDGVNLDQCASISRQASALLDVEDPISHHYTLEVTSPGLDRKMYSSDDYDRFKDKNVRIKMKPSYRDHRLVVGRLLGLVEENVQVVPEGEENAIDLPLSEVFETRLEVDWRSVLK